MAVGGSVRDDVCPSCHFAIRPCVFLKNRNDPMTGTDPPSQEWVAPAYSQRGSSRSLSVPELVGLTREILHRGVPFRFSAPGTSMSPFIRDGDIITIAPCDPATCRPGDVVGFVRPPDSQAFVVHRVVALEDGGCRIRGDNTREDDGIIPYDCIAGRVIRVERAGKPVRLGLGPERYVIALLSRNGRLRYFLSKAGSVVAFIRSFS